MMKIVMIFDQIQSGMGTKDDAMLPMSGKKVAIGPAVMMEKDIKEVDGQILACLYCGTSYYHKNPQEVTRKFCAMIEKLKPDVVICGPAYDYKDYANMCAHVGSAIALQKVPVIIAMAKENMDIITQFKDKIPIVKTPEKGGVGLHLALHNICVLAKQMIDEDIDKDLLIKICF